MKSKKTKTMKKAILIVALMLTIIASVFYACKKEKISTTTSTDSLIISAEGKSSDVSSERGTPIAKMDGDNFTFLIPQSKILSGLKRVQDERIVNTATTYYFYKAEIIKDNGIYWLKGVGSNPSNERLTLFLSLVNTPPVVNVSELTSFVVDCLALGCCDECADTQCACHSGGGPDCSSCKVFIIPDDPIGGGPGRPNTPNPHQEENGRIIVKDVARFFE